jgi:hypothetical protein
MKQALPENAGKPATLTPSRPEKNGKQRKKLAGEYGTSRLP